MIPPLPLKATAEKKPQKLIHLAQASSFVGPLYKAIEGEFAFDEVLLSE